VLEDLRREGFTFIRLPLQPDLLTPSAPLVDEIARVQRHGLAVVVALFADGWHLESDSRDRARLIATWRALATALRPLDPRLTFPEVLNEPVFQDDPASWPPLQRQVVSTIRSVLPQDTIVLTGPNWGSVAGLLSLSPEPDPKLIYSFHFYEPPELTSLAAYRPGLDRAAMAKLPFPVRDEAGCDTIAETTADPPTADLVRFYCAQHWDVAAVAAHIAAAGAWARQNHATVIVGEYGASERLNPVARINWLSTVRNECEHQGFGWALWGYDDSMGMAVTFPAKRHAIDPEIASALGIARAK